MRRVLVLRPEPGASATVEKARRLGLDAVAVPLFEVEPVGWQVPDASAFDGLLLTSPNALRHGGEGLQRLRGMQVYAVGEATARAAREMGFDVASVGDGGVDRLLDSIDPDLRLLHLCGADRIAPASARQAVTAVAVYRSREVADRGEFPADSVALIHSPRAGRRFAELIDDRSGFAIAAISPQAAKSLGGGWESVQSAARATDEALLALAASLCNKPEAG